MIMTWLPVPSIRGSLRLLADEDLQDAWEASYHTVRSLVGCRRPLRGPLIQLWSGYETALVNYATNASAEMERRHLTCSVEHDLLWAVIEDGPHVTGDKEADPQVPPSVIISHRYIHGGTIDLQKGGFLPRWFGWKPFHRSHQQALYNGSIDNLVYPWRTNERHASHQGRSRRSRAVLAHP